LFPEYDLTVSVTVGPEALAVYDEEDELYGLVNKHVLDPEQPRAAERKYK